jgi:single-strand DNA-binding protein
MVNKAILMGNLGDDPETREVGDSSVTNIRIATNETYKDKNGEQKTVTEWHSVELWGGLSKVASKYLHKGSMVYIEGKIKTEMWEDDKGQKRKNVKIRALSMKMLGGKSDTPQTAPTNIKAVVASSKSNSVTEDDLPF